MAGNGFNIFDYVDEMKKAGMPHQQADILARALHGVASESAATKHDLEFAKLELKKDIEIVRKDIEMVRSELKQDIEIVRKDIEMVRSELKQDIEMVRSELKQEIKGLDVKIETVRAGLKKDMRYNAYTIIASLAAIIFTMAKFGLLSIQ